MSLFSSFISGFYYLRIGSYLEESVILFFFVLVIVSKYPVSFSALSALNHRLRLIQVSGLAAALTLLNQASPENTSILSVFLASLLLCLALNGAQNVFPSQYRSSTIHIQASLTGSTLLWVLSRHSRALWEGFHQFSLSFIQFAVHRLLPKELLHIAGKRIVFSDYAILIEAECSGVEGMGLIFIFLSVFLFLKRKDYKFPQSFLLLGLGILLSFLFNGLRIVLLLLIGAYISPGIATHGFHSSFGWIYFSIINYSILYFSLRSSFFSKSPQHLTDLSGKHNRYIIHEPNPPLQVVTPFLWSREAGLIIPMLCVIIGGLITSLLWGGRQAFFYPVFATIGITALYYYRSFYNFKSRSISARPLLMGAVIFIPWLLFCKSDLNAANELKRDIFALTPVYWGPWLLFKCLGFCVVTPIIEEFAFRGYFLPKLFYKLRLTQSKKISQIGSLILSSLLFGLLHQHVFIAFLTGLLYGLLWFQSRRLFNCILAHSATNTLIFVYSLSTGNWQLF